MSEAIRRLSVGITDDQVLSLASGDESLLVTSDKDFRTSQEKDIVELRHRAQIIEHMLDRLRCYGDLVFAFDCILVLESERHRQWIRKHSVPVSLSGRHEFMQRADYRCPSALRRTCS